MSPITMAILGLLAYKALKSMTHHEQPAPAGGPPRPGNGGGAAGRDLPPPRDMQTRSIPSRDMGSRDTSSNRDISSDMEPRDADMGRGMMPDRGDFRQGEMRTSTGGDTSSGGMAGGGRGEQQQEAGQGGSLGDLLKGALGGLLAGSAAGGVMGGGLNDLIKQLQKHGFTDETDSWVGSGENKTIPPGDLAKVLGADQIEAMMEHSGLSREEVLDGLSKHLPEFVHKLTPEGKVPRDIPM